MLIKANYIHNKNCSTYASCHTAVSTCWGPILNISNIKRYCTQHARGDGSPFRNTAPPKHRHSDAPPFRNTPTPNRNGSVCFKVDNPRYSEHQSEPRLYTVYCKWQPSGA